MGGNGGKMRENVWKKRGIGDLGDPDEDEEEEEHNQSLLSSPLWV